MGKFQPVWLVSCWNKSFNLFVWPLKRWNIPESTHSLANVWKCHLHKKEKNHLRLTAFIISTTNYKQLFINRDSSMASSGRHRTTLNLGLGPFQLQPKRKKLLAKVKIENWMLLYLSSYWSHISLVTRF